MPKSALDALLLPGSLASGFYLRPRRIKCRSSPYAHQSTTAASAVASASSNVNRRLPPCGFADAPARLRPGFLQALCRLVFSFVQDIGGRPHRCRAVGHWRYRGMFRIGSFLVGNLPVLSGTEDLKSKDFDALRSLGVLSAGCTFHLVQQTGFAPGGLHVVNCDGWTSWSTGLHWLCI